jgi:hypothetical protein
MIVPTQLALKTHTNLGCAASFATLDKLVDKFTLPPAALPIGDASLTHVIKLAAHSTTSPTPTAMRQSFIMTPYFVERSIFLLELDIHYADVSNYISMFYVHSDNAIGIEITL